MNGSDPASLRCPRAGVLAVGANRLAGQIMDPRPSFPDNQAGGIPMAIKFDPRPAPSFSRNTKDAPTSPAKAAASRVVDAFKPADPGLGLRSKAAHRADRPAGGSGPVDKKERGPGLRSAKDAIAEATEFFQADRSFMSPVDQMVGGTIVKDPRDVTRVTEQDNAAALKQLEKNQALERQALAKLTPSQRAEYLNVAKKLQNNPQALLALQVMLLDGRLASPQKACNGDTLLGGLDKLANQPLAPGMSTSDLLGQVVRELAFPASINQMDKQTCGAASLQIQLARENPAEYVRLVAGLASPSGEVKLANGDTLKREPGWDGFDLRSMSSRLLQSAFMEYANGAEWDYDPASDKSKGTTDANKGLSGYGLEASEIARLAAGLFGREAKQIPEKFVDSNGDGIADPLTDDQANRILAAAPTVVGLKFADGRFGAHAVLVTGVRDGRVYFIDPKDGMEVSMPVAEFKQKLLNGIVDGR